MKKGYTTVKITATRAEHEHIVRLLVANYVHLFKTGGAACDLHAIARVIRNWPISFFAPVGTKTRPKAALRSARAR